MTDKLNGGRSSPLHLGLFALSLVGEFNTIRNKIKSNDKSLFYLSSSISQLELLGELVFEHLSEKVEPLIYFFEVIKALLKLKEYTDLITKEKLACYISKERYEEHKKDEERRKSMLMLPRSGKNLPKPAKFPISNKMLKYMKKSVSSVDSLQSVGDSPALHNFDYYREHPIGHDPVSGSSRGMLSTLSRCFTKKLKMIKKLLFSRKLNLTEIALIIRPVLYIYLLLKHGKESFTPFLVSLGIELSVILYGIYRIAKFKTDTEKEELQYRWKGLFKYFLKEPCFSRYTVKYLYIILSRIISDGKIGYILSFLTYMKYYSYIA